MGLKRGSFGAPSELLGPMVCSRGVASTVATVAMPRWETGRKRTERTGVGLSAKSGAERSAVGTTAVPQSF